MMRAFLRRTQFWRRLKRTFLIFYVPIVGLVIAATILVALHAPSGKTIYLNGGEVMAITEGGPPLTTPGCRADVLVHDRWFCVKESPDEVKALIDSQREN